MSFAEFQAYLAQAIRLAQELEETRDVRNDYECACSAQDIVSHLIAAEQELERLSLLLDEAEARKAS